MDTPTNIPQIKPDTVSPDQPEPSGKSNPSPDSVPQDSPTSNPKLTTQKKNGPLKLVLLSLAILVVGLSILIGLPALNAFSKGKSAYAQSQKLIEAFKSQDLPRVKTEIENSRKSIADLRGSLLPLYWIKFIPFVGVYISDADHALAAAGFGLEAAEITAGTLEPYADLIGFTSSQTETGKDGAKTAQERIDFVIKSIPELVPKLDPIAEKITAARAEMDQVDPERYPVEFRGKKVRENIKQAKGLIKDAATLVTQGRPLLEAAPYLLGVDDGRQYLVLFQNDKELRPTGGFITAYSIMKVEDGKFEPVTSNDIYNLDTRYRPVTPAPDPIVKYIRGPYIQSKNIRLRDMNWSPDFKVSMELFLKEAEKVGIRGIDGVIAVDTQLLVNLLNAIGPIGVPGFGNFSTLIVPECECPQVIHELESFADVEGPIVWDPNTGEIVYRPPNSDNRKRIIGPLMNSILANAMGQPKEKLPGLFEAGFKSLVEKHVLFYLYDDKAQSAVESFGIAGRLKDVGGDYLHINDANLGGRKSNLYVTQEVDQEMSLSGDGSVEKILTITYKNPKEHDGWLNSVLPNWVRVYVPKGSELISIDGVEDKVEPYEDLGKTVFAGFFRLRPQGVAKVILRYRLPFKVKKDYNLLIQKQPGTDSPLYRISAPGFEEELFLKTDKEFKLRI